MWTEGMTWANPPALATMVGDTLHVTTGDQGDFWRTTFYGFVHDNGHALLAPAAPEFSAEVTFNGDWQAQYDQAGLFLRADEAHWIKAGIEHVNGTPHLATVVTCGNSDWSQMPLPGFTGDLGLRLTRVGDAVWVQYRLTQDWKMFRLAHFPSDLPASVGPMACSPSRAGLNVRFHDFHLGPPISRQPY
jgi:regulation of enolase protein 1 (concanavalin A-like superfamily)